MPKKICSKCGFACEGKCRVRKKEKRKTISKRKEYGNDWIQVRLQILKNQPLCGFCKERISKVVHHIDGVKKSGHTNLLALCEECHNRETGKKEGWKNLNRGREL